MSETSGIRTPGDSFFSAGRTAIFLIAGITLVTYAGILNNALFLDDLDFIVNNAYLRDWRYFPQLFSESMTAGAGKVGDYYRPMMQFVFMAGHSLWGLNPMGYHLLSIVFHAANGILFYWLMRRTNITPALALAAALLFITHPAQTEAVASASALGILLGAFFGLAAILLHWRAQEVPPRLSWALIGLSCISAALSILSKETMVVLPGLIFLATFYFIAPSAGLTARFRIGIAHSIPYLAIALLYVALRFTVLNFGGTSNLFREENLFTSNWLARFFTFMAVLKELGAIVIWPSTLFMERSTLIPVYLTPMARPVLLGLALFTTMIATGLWISAKSGPATLPQKMIPMGLFWIFFCLVPVSNVFIPISTTIVESWLYMPIAGVLLVAAGILHPRLSGLSGIRAYLMAAFCAALLLLAVGKSIEQNRIWNNPVSFYEHSLTHAPLSARFRNNLAMAYSDQGRREEAIHQYQAAIQLNDQYPETHHNLALLHQESGNAQEAEREFLRAITMNPKFHFSYLSLSALYLNLKRPDLAQGALEALVKNIPERWEGYYNLGVLYALKGNRAEARALWQKGLAIDPYSKNLAEILEKN